MGNSASRAVKEASKLSASNTARKYPTRSPVPPSESTNARQPKPAGDGGLEPTVYPEASAVSSRDPAIERDASDPDLALNERMRQLGPVTPNPTQSNSSTFNFTPPASFQSSHKASSSRSSSSTDPSTNHTSFTPSASNPSQSIFPAQSQSAQSRSQNPAVSLLTARYRLAEEADKEFADLGRKGAEGRSFVDVVTLRQILVLREQGMQNKEIESRLGLKSDVVGKLGRKRVVGFTS